MKLSELRLEIKEGDVINGRHVAERFSMIYAYCGDRKFMIVSGGSRYAEKINTVSRDGEIYFRRRRRGGANNVHRRGGQYA
jgi:hypothetical protein